MDTARLRHSAAADRWTWLVLAAHTQLRLARPLATDLRRPWEKPAPPHKLTPSRVRRGFRNLRTTAGSPAGAPKPTTPGPGRPPGLKNRHPATRHDVGRVLGVTGPHLRVGHRTVTKREERSNGADVGVVVDVRVPGRLQPRTGDLIQVKKSVALTPGRAGREDAWTVKREQLHTLLEHSASAVYWLIRGNGDVLVVPAKFLAAVDGATARPSSKQFTVGYTAVRHTAVAMEQYLPDLVVGLWPGSSSDRTLQAAQGTGRTTRPRFALIIDIVLEHMEG